MCRVYGVFQFFNAFAVNRSDFISFVSRYYQIVVVVVFQLRMFLNIAVAKVFDVAK
jgi:hypothetical protein